MSESEHAPLPTTPRGRFRRPARLLLAALLGLAVALPAAAQQMATPFGRPGPANPPAAAACAVPPRAVRDLQAPSPYAGRDFNRSDPQRLAANVAASQPLREWLRGMQVPAERWVALRDAEAAACALSQLDAWAQAGAMLGRFNAPAANLRMWTLAGAALTYLALRDAPAATPERQARIGAWLAAVAREVQPNSAEGAVTNLDAWSGLAVAASGVAAGDRALVRWGMARGRRVLAGVTPEGAHREEVKRGQMALHYHLFALAPLAALDRLGAAAGQPFGPNDRAALERLARFTWAQTQDSSRLQQMTGARQTTHGGVTDRWLAAGEGFEILGGDPAISAALQPYRPLRDHRLGGNVTLLWGAGSAPGAPRGRPN